MAIIDVSATLRGSSEVLPAVTRRIEVSAVLRGKAKAMPPQPPQPAPDLKKE